MGVLDFTVSIQRRDVPFLSKCSNVAVPLLLTSGLAAAPFHPADRVLVAQADAPQEAQDPPVKQTRPRKVAKPKPVKPVAAAPAPAAPAPTPIPVQSPQPAPPAPTRPAFVSQKLIEAGAGCTGHVDTIARGALAGTKTFVPEASWRAGDAAKHMVGVMIGQSFGDGAKVPHGITGIVAAPGQAGAPCDAYTFQVLPSPLSCKEIQTTIDKNGKPVGDLAGLPLLRDAAGQIVLLPGETGAGCIVVGFHTEY